MTGSRRLARPVRLSLKSHRGDDIDGAWWPHTASVAAELPELIENLQHPLGEIIDISINWSATEGPLDFNTLIIGTRATVGAPRRPPRLMVVAGRSASATLLVVPHMTSPDLGLLVMRRAAAKPVTTMPQDAKLLETVEQVLRAAHAESARWAVTATEPVAVQPD